MMFPLLAVRFASRRTGGRSPQIRIGVFPFEEAIHA